MKIPAGQLAFFRIYPEKGKSRLYFDVRVFASVKAIRRYVKASDMPSRTLGRYGLAMCSSWIRIRIRKGRLSPRRLPDMGEILFPVRGLTAGVIAHECTHAALAWAARVGLNPVERKFARGDHLWASKAEERFCYGLGELNRQIAVVIWDKGLHA